MYVADPLAGEGPGTWVPLADGPGQLESTLAVIRRLVAESLRYPETKRAAVLMASHVRPTDTDGYIKAVFDGVRTRVGYVPDTWQIEQTAAPQIHSRRILASGRSWGDCDDYAALGAAWLLSLGVPARFAVIASPKNGGRWDHIRVEARNAAGVWVPLETTMRRLRFGQAVPGLRHKYTEVI